MTNEEAIAILEEQSNFNRRFQHYFEATSVEIKKDKVISPMLVADRYRELAEAMDIAIAKLKNKSMGDPLTLEQLREMDGKPVWVERNESPHDGKWFIVDHADIENPDKTLYTKEGVTYSDYGAYFTAYAYPPAHIDREAWEPCAKCVGCGNCYYFLYDDDEYPCNKCLKESTDKNQYPKFEPIGFCKHCGRPLTEEAWAELGKRLRG